MITNAGAGTEPRMRPALRWALLASACAAAAVAWLPEEEAVSVAPARATAASTRPGRVAGAPSPPLPSLASLPSLPSLASLPSATVRPGLAPAVASPAAPWPPLSRAAQAAWVPAPAPRVAAPAPAASVAAPPPTPAFPYQWIGQIDEAGQLRVFLVDAQRLWAVAPGETVQPGWRVDGIGAGGLQLTWQATGATVKIAARP